MSHKPAPPPTLLDEYFDGMGLALELNTTQRSIYRWRSKRKGPPGTIIGGKLYFRKSAVKEWLLRREESQPA